MRRAFDHGVPRGNQNCISCTRWRPVSDFRPYFSHKRRSEYLRHVCVPCEKARDKERFNNLDYAKRQALRERTREYAASRRRREGKPVRKVTRDGYGANHARSNIGKRDSVDPAPVLRACARAGLSVGQVAKMAEVDPRSVNRWQNGEERMSLDAADRLCLALGLHLSLIFGCED